MNKPESIGRYELIEEIGHGGMAVVYLARDNRLQRDVALKLLAAHLERKEAVMDRFAQEARIIAGLDHPHIVTIFDFGTYEERPYLVMRYLRGGTFGEHWAGKPVVMTDLWPIAMQIAAALDDAHNHGIVHRDIKPSNLLFDNYGRVYVADFGVAKIAGNTTRITKRQRILGTPTYMSPEQCAEQEEVSPQSDQYSLAVVLFEALSGQPPFQGDTLALMYQHTHEPPPLVHDLNEGLPKALSDVLVRALSKDPQRRYPNVTSFVTALQESSKTAIKPQVKGPRPIALSDGTTYVEPESPNFEAGREAMAKGNWRMAIACFNRVGPSDPYYGRSISQKREARKQLMSAKPLPSNPPPSWEERSSEKPNNKISKPGKDNISRNSLDHPSLTAHQTWANQIGRILRRTGVIIAAILGIIIIAIFLIVLIEGPNDDPGPEESEDNSAVEPVEPGVNQEGDESAVSSAVPDDLIADTNPTLDSEFSITVLDAAEGATWFVGGQEQMVQSKGQIPLPSPGTSLLTINTGQGKMAIETSTGEHLYLGPETEITIESLSGSYEAEESKFVILEGRLVVEGAGYPLSIANPFGSQIEAEGSLLGVMIEESSQNFHAHCLQATQCMVNGEAGGSLRLLTGQACEIDGSGIAERIIPVRVELFTDLTAAVPTATAIPQPTSTATPSPTATFMAPPVLPTSTNTTTPTPEITATPNSDIDQDGTLDHLDQCPGQFGPGDRNGCPRDKDNGSDEDDFSRGFSINS